MKLIHLQKRLGQLKDRGDLFQIAAPAFAAKQENEKRKLNCKPGDLAIITADKVENDDLKWGYGVGGVLLGRNLKGVQPSAIRDHFPTRHRGDRTIPDRALGHF